MCVFEQMLVRHILKQDLATSLEDSLKLAETYKLNSSEIYYIYCIQLLEKNEVCSSVCFVVYLSAHPGSDPIMMTGITLDQTWAFYGPSS